MKIYTKTGDKGRTSLASGKRVSKSDVRLEAYGTADELNSYVGWLRSAVRSCTGTWVEATDTQLGWIQNRLFDIGAILAGADMVFAWDNAEIGTMEAKLAAKIICNGQGADKIDECAKEYAALQNNVVSAAKRGYVDQVIDAADTRKYVIGAFEMLFTKSEDRPVKKHGTV